MRLSLDEFRQIVSMVIANDKKPVIVELPVIKNESITIRVEADDDSNLNTPLEIEGQKITMLGVYEIKHNKIWVVKN